MIILVIEDNRQEMALLRETLSDLTSVTIRLEHVDRLSAACSCLAARRFDVMLLDLNLPDSTGLDTLARVQAQAPDVPVVIMTGLDDERLAAEGVRRGAQDYLVKGRCDGALIYRSLRYAVERKRLVTDLEARVAERTAELEAANQILQRDITERKRTAEALKLFRGLLDQADDSVEIIDPATGRFLDCNESSFSILGYTRQEFLSLTVPDIDPIVTAPIFAQTVTKIRETGALTLETLHRRKDGSTFPVEVQACLIQLDQEYLLAIVRDITERKRVEMELRFARFTIERANEAVYWINPQANILDVNEAACVMLGYSKAEFMAMTVHDINPDFPRICGPIFGSKPRGAPRLPSRPTIGRRTAGSFPSR